MSMHDDPDLSRLAAIGDPFADDANAPARATEAPRIPGGEGASPTRSNVRRARRIAFAAALVFEVTGVILDPHRRDLSGASPLELFAGLAIPLAAATLAFAAVTQRGPHGLGLRARSIAILAAAAPAFFLLATLVGAPDTAADPRFWRHAAGCAGVTAFLTLGPLALGLGAFRRAFVAAAPWRTAALGVAAGALAACTMSLICPITGAWHVIVGHGAMMLAAGLAGALLAPALSRS